MELSKPDKKKARAIIEKGLMKEFERGLNQADAILSNWKQGKGDNREAYHALYKHITQFDKGIARRYDGLGNSYLIDIIIQQLNENLIEQQDLQVFSQEGQDIFELIFKMRHS
jgi:hypothetical protein